MPLLNSDMDFNDFVVIVESVHPLPDPAALGMFGLGALMIDLFAGLRRRREEIWGGYPLQIQSRLSVPSNGPPFRRDIFLCHVPRA